MKNKGKVKRRRKERGRRVRRVDEGRWKRREKRRNMKEKGRGGNIREVDGVGVFE